MVLEYAVHSNDSQIFTRQGRVQIASLRQTVLSAAWAEHLKDGDHHDAPA